MRRTPPVVPPEVVSLVPFADAGVFDATEVHLAATVARLQPGLSDDEVLALALAARGPRLGHVCVELADAEALVVDLDDEAVADLPWPEPERWAKTLADSPVVAEPGHEREEPLRPLVWDGRRIYLQRYFCHETAAAEHLLRRASHSAAGVDGVDMGLGLAGPALEEALAALFPPGATSEPDLQQEAARIALTGHIAVVAGGPGTGKTRTVARLLAAATRAADTEGRPLEIGLAAPTGKAAARMAEALRSEVAAAEDDGALTASQAESLRAVEATTLHRLLGWLPGATTRFRHDRHQPLPHDLVVVDEVSMVSLPLVARLLEAVRPDAALVLVGDPSQLASVEAGTVLGDVVGPAVDGEVPAEAPLASRVTVLRRIHRFAADSAIAELAEAVRAGDVERSLDLLRSRTGADAGVEWVLESDQQGRQRVLDQLVDAGAEAVRAALDGDATLALEATQRVKVLAATRRHDLGLWDWSDRIEEGVAARVPELHRTSRWYPGRPVLITANDPLAQVANGDVGVLVQRGDDRSVALPTGDGIRFLAPSRLDAVDTWWAMTIHKSQGSELPHAVVSLPAADSPILTRELLYTAVTRARAQVTVVGSEAAIVAAIERPVARASGLRHRLWPT
jgi:exodeoxyribonuclease V alpha subunit